MNIPAWREFPLVDTLREVLPGRPVRLAGDAQCMALGEWWRGLGGDGAARSRAMLGMVVSTGVGGGLVLDGVPYVGPTGNAGHIGHITVDPGGEPCPCGGVGCVETIASGPGMVRWATANGWTGADARALAADARTGHPTAVTAFRRAADALATAVLTASALFDLDHVVIGGAWPPRGRFCSARSGGRSRGTPGSASCDACGWTRPPWDATPGCSAPPPSSCYRTTPPSERGHLPHRRIRAEEGQRYPGVTDRNRGPP